MTTPRKKPRKTTAVGPVNETAHAGLRQSLDQIEKLLTQVLGSVQPGKIKVESPNDLYKLSVAAASIARAKTELYNWQTERDFIKAEVQAELEEAMQSALASRPELYEQLREVLCETADIQAQNLLPE
jgi:hypothetical protein